MFKVILKKVVFDNYSQSKVKKWILHNTFQNKGSFSNYVGDLKFYFVSFLTFSFP